MLDLIAENHLHMDIATFGTLALGCKEFKDGMLLLQNMNVRSSSSFESLHDNSFQILSNSRTPCIYYYFLHQEAGFRPNIEIMGALAHKAMITKNCWYLLKVIKVIQSEGISPSTKLITELEEFLVSIKHFIVEEVSEKVLIYIIFRTPVTMIHECKLFAGEERR